MPHLEIACFTSASALTAAASGADRIELCANRDVGGTTPDHSELIMVKQSVSIPVMTMIRPRGGDFCYSPEEFEQMKVDIQKSTTADGFVFGILTADKEVDKERNAKLIKLAAGKPCTFHRAFDEVADWEEALKSVMECGFGAVLTSGPGAPNAIAGVEVLEKLVDRAGEKIVIICGGGMRSSNIRELKQRTRASWYHSSAIVDGAKAGAEADEKEIKELKAQLNG